MWYKITYSKYFFPCRYLGKLKRHVSNWAQPEGSITETYILKECITNRSFYIDGIETMHNWRKKNEDFGESRKGLIVFSQIAWPIGGRWNDGNLSNALLDTAHWYLLYNSPKLEPYLKYVISYAYIIWSSFEYYLQCLAEHKSPYF